MRSTLLLLLCCAAAAADAQLLGYAAWPMRGRNAQHLSDALLPVPNNSVAVRVNVTGGAILSSPAVGADGVTYVGSDDQYLYAINADGSLKWKFETSGAVRSSPAVGADGVVYVGAGSYEDPVSNLYAINADGTQKWVFQLHSGATVEQSSPALGDGAVYVADDKGCLYAVSTADGSLKWNGLDQYVPGQSPAVGPDGSVYALVSVVPGATAALRASTPDGKQQSQWQFPELQDGCTFSSPTLSGDGTAYFLGCGLVAMNSSGHVIWTYGDDLLYDNYLTNSGSNPALAPDGSVYVGACKSAAGAEDAAAEGAVYGVYPNGTLKWKYETGCVASSPAVGAEGVVYVGSDDHYLYAIYPNGTLKWRYEAGDMVRSSPGVGADGVVYVGSHDKKLHMVGLSAGHVTTELHLAELRLVLNSTATAHLEHVCNYTADIHFAPQCNPSFGCNVCEDCCKDYIAPSACGACFAEACPPRNQRFDPGAVQGVATACQMLNNTRNSRRYGGPWKMFVEPLSFKDYRARVAAGGSLMTLLTAYETALRDFEQEDASLADRASAAKNAAAGYGADAANWRDHMKRDRATLAAYGEELISLSVEVDKKYAAVGGDVHALVEANTKHLNDLNDALKKAEDKFHAKVLMEEAQAAYKVVVALWAVAACTLESSASFGLALFACGKQSKDQLEAAYKGVKQVQATVKVGCPACKDDQKKIAAITALGQELDNVNGMVVAMQKLNSQLNSSRPLPEELPTLLSDEVSIVNLRDYSSVLRSSIQQQMGPHLQFESDIQDWMDLSMMRVQKFLSYYHIATRVQNDAGALSALKTRVGIVNGAIQSTLSQEAVVAAGAYLINEQRQKQASLIIKYVYEEWKQFDYFSLGNAPPLKLSADPTSTEILKFQSAMDTAYETEITKQEASSKGWIHIEIPVSAENATIRSLQANHTGTVVLPVPLRNVTDPGTNATRLEADTLYYQMRMFDLAVFLLDAHHNVLGTAEGPTQVYVSKSGVSSFFDEDLQLHSFAHREVTYGTGVFTYDANTGCALSQNYCGDLCPDYIRYSPFGTWNVTVFSPEQQGIDMSKLASVRLEFEVSYQQKPGYSPNLFGKSPKRYPQNFGQLCKKEEDANGPEDNNNDFVLAARTRENQQVSRVARMFGSGQYHNEQR